MRVRTCEWASERKHTAPNDMQSIMQTQLNTNCYAVGRAWPLAALASDTTIQQLDQQILQPQNPRRYSDWAPTIFPSSC
jgi:hypothetical protein